MANLRKMNDYLEQSENYINYIIDIINDPNEQAAKKQVTFLDNQTQISECMDGLMKFKDKCNELLKDEDGSEEGKEKIRNMLNKAEQIQDNMKNAAEELKKQLSNIDPNEKLEDNQVKLTADTLNDAVKNNKTTQEISKNMNDIANQVKNQQAVQSKMPKASYALVVEGKTTYIQANDINTLNTKIQHVLNGYSGQDVVLYQISYTQMPLKTKTTYSVI